MRVFFLNLHLTLEHVELYDIYNPCIAGLKIGKTCCNCVYIPSGTR